MFFRFTYKFYKTLFNTEFLYLNRRFTRYISKKLSHLDKNVFFCSSVVSENVRCFSKSVALQNVHTTKGWKVIARTGKRAEEISDTDQPPTSCEEGTDAIPHSVLISHLQDCRTVSEQIERFSTLISITAEDVERRLQFCNYLTEVFRPYFSKFKVHQFGSSINGLGFKGCDMDISIQTIFDDQDYLTNVREIPTLESVIHGSIPDDTISRLPPRLLLRFVRRILRRNCSDIQEPILLIKGRCPILRFYNKKYNVFCDFSCENKFSLRNTKLLRIMCLLDPRFPVLTKVIRYWGKYGGFVGDIDMFNSYAFSLLVVHFLQQTDPPVLPPIQYIVDKSVYINHGDVNDDEMLMDDVKKFELSKNTQSAEELLKEYFFYFLSFDYSMMMIPLTSSIVPKASFIPSVTNSEEPFMFSPVTVHDPFRPNFNTTAGATFRNCKKFLNSTVEACKLYQNQNVWNPSYPNWGIASLFQKALSEQEVSKEWQRNRTFKFFLPLKSKPDIVRTILQDCLLFECVEMQVGHFLKLHCKVYNNTWQGRDCFRQKLSQSSKSILEIENSISKEIVKSRGEDKKQILFTFTCNLYVNADNNRFEVELSFPESKCSPIVPIFLKDYISSVYKKLNF